MTELLERPIKEVIAEHPALGELLEREGIACVSCAAGSCRTREIIEVHGLSAERERAVLELIAGVVYPGRAVNISQVARAPGNAGASASLSPPLRTLVEEHRLILRWLSLVPSVAASLRAGEPGALDAARTGVELLREYADRFHHAKEEDTLFACFDAELEIVKSMRAEHEVARGHVRSASAALAAGDGARAADGLEAHRDLLREHIRKEDELLFPWMDRKLTTAEVGRLFAAFSEIERQAGGRPLEIRASLEGLEGRFAEPVTAA